MPSSPASMSSPKMPGMSIWQMLGNPSATLGSTQLTSILHGKPVIPAQSWAELSQRKTTDPAKATDPRAKNPVQPPAKAFPSAAASPTTAQAQITPPTTTPFPPFPIPAQTSLKRHPAIKRKPIRILAQKSTHGDRFVRLIWRIIQAEKTLRLKTSEAQSLTSQLSASEVLVAQLTNSHDDLAAQLQLNKEHNASLQTALAAANKVARVQMEKLKVGDHGCVFDHLISHSREQQRQILDLKQRSVFSEQNTKSLQHQLNEREAQVKNLEKQNSQFSKDLAEANAKILKQFWESLQCQAMKNSVARLEKELCAAKEDAEHCRNQSIKQSEEIVSLRKELDEAQNAVQIASQKEVSMQKEIDDMKAEAGKTRAEWQVQNDQKTQLLHQQLVEARKTAEAAEEQRLKHQHDIPLLSQQCEQERKTNQMLTMELLRAEAKLEQETQQWIKVLEELKTTQERYVGILERRACARETELLERLEEVQSNRGVWQFVKRRSGSQGTSQGLDKGEMKVYKEPGKVKKFFGLGKSKGKRGQMMVNGEWEVVDRVSRDSTGSTSSSG